MKQIDRRRLAAFVSQRMEMGESEWFLPESLVSPALETTGPRKSPSARTPAVKAATPRAGISEPLGTCVKESFDREHIVSQSTLDDLDKAVCGCRRCQLGSTRMNFVFGAGNPNADIMFIGEAPGADEDAQGVPFVGRAGQLLTKMIEAMKLSRDDVYIGNILKCRPPNNRDPKPEEIEMCEPILIRQIEIIQPKIICALGRISGQTLLRTKATLGALRGKFHDYHGVKFIVTYHPAALLRNPNWKKDAWEDLKLVRREYDGLEL